MFGGAAGGVALDQIQLAQFRIAFLTIGQFAGQAKRIEHAFAAGEFAGFTRGFAGAGGVDDFAADDFGVVGFFQQEFHQLGGDNFFDCRAYFGGDQLFLGLRGKFRLWHFHR